MDFPWGNLITAVSTLSAVWLTQAVGAGQRREERNWQLKYEAYKSVVAAARTWQEDLVALIKAKEHGGAAHRDVMASAMDGGRNLADVYNANILPLSSDFLDAIQAYRKKMAEPSGLKGHEADQFLITQTRHLAAHLEVIAIRELQLDTPARRGWQVSKWFSHRTRSVAI